MIGVINMNTNNINCIVKILKKFKFTYKVINKYDDYSDSIEKIIIPGIGNYNLCMRYITENNLDKIIYEHIHNNKKLMGICIGMQILTSCGYEGQHTIGLNLIKDSNTVKMSTNEILPNIGWSNIKINMNHKLLKDINYDCDFYFVHSYHVLTSDLTNVIATSTYGNCEFNAIIIFENILAVQFHPEKSGSNGIKLIENFLKW